MQSGPPRRRRAAIRLPVNDRPNQLSPLPLGLDIS